MEFDSQIGNQCAKAKLLFYLPGRVHALMAYLPRKTEKAPSFQISPVASIASSHPSEYPILKIVRTSPRRQTVNGFIARIVHSACIPYSTYKTSMRTRRTSQS
jgi:hypothetical protein